MQLVLCDCYPPSAPDPAGADGGHYEELPVSVPPHVPQGLSRDDAPAPLDQWEERAYAEALEKLTAPPPEITETSGTGVGDAWPWLRAAFASVYERVVAPVSFCGRS